MLLCEETTDLLQNLSLDTQPKAAADATGPAAGAKKVEIQAEALMGSHLVRVDGLIEIICDSDSIAYSCCLFNQQGAVTSQPLSVAIPPERSITPVLQDFMDPNLFYLPAYYYGGEKLMLIMS